MELPTTVKDLTDKGFISARPVVVFPTIADRDCIAQGVVCPTVFNVRIGLITHLMYKHHGSLDQWLQLI